MIIWPGVAAVTVPRASGGDPITFFNVQQAKICSPRKRG